MGELPSALRRYQTTGRISPIMYTGKKAQGSTYKNMEVTISPQWVLIVTMSVYTMSEKFWRWTRGWSEPSVFLSLSPLWFYRLVISVCALRLPKAPGGRDGMGGGSGSSISLTHTLTPITASKNLDILATFDVTCKSFPNTSFLLF